MALPIDVPGNGCEARTNSVVPRTTGCRTCVLCEFDAHSCIRVNNHAVEEIWIEVIFVIDDSEYLSLNANLLECIERVKRNNTIAAEDTIIEGSLILIDSSTGTSSGMGPMNFVRLPYMYAKNLSAHVVKTRG